MVKPMSKLDRYSFPKVEDFFAAFAGVKVLKIDLSQVYQ